VSIREIANTKIIIVDDATPDPKTVAGFASIAGSFKNVRFCRVPGHVQHGLTLDFALSKTDVPWVITCDHDMIINSSEALAILLGQVGKDVGAVGAYQNNTATKELGPYVHPSWALWNAKALRKYNISFAGFGIKGKGPRWDFATGQFTCYRLGGLGLGSGEKGEVVQKPLKIISVNFKDTVTHAQVWQERGDTWREKVRG